MEKVNIKRPFNAGEVALVGAGPGDVELLTLRAIRFIEQAEVVIYDRLVSPEVLALLPKNSENYYVGKEQAKHCVPQAKINEMLVYHAKQDKKVLRLKGGDPFIFGRGGEEAEFLLQQGVSCHVCPGITAASGCSAYAGIPLTYRGVAHGCTFITGHMQDDGQLNLPWKNLVTNTQTLVFYMGINSLPIITAQLIAHGQRENTPVALIYKGTQPDQKVFRSILKDVDDMVQQQGIVSPTLIVIGQVVNQLTDQHLSESGFLEAKKII